MIKGVGRQIVLLSNTESEIFEQAIFILRRSGNIPHNDMVKECERIINTHIRTHRQIKMRNYWKIGFFAMCGISLLLGILCIL